MCSIYHYRVPYHLVCGLYSRSRVQKEFASFEQFATYGPVKRSVQLPACIVRPSLSWISDRSAYVSQRLRVQLQHMCEHWALGTLFALRYSPVWGIDIKCLDLVFLVGVEQNFINLSFAPHRCIVLRKTRVVTQGCVKRGASRLARSQGEGITRAP